MIQGLDDFLSLREPRSNRGLENLMSEEEYNQAVVLKLEEEKKMAALPKKEPKKEGGDQQSLENQAKGNQGEAQKQQKS